MLLSISVIFSLFLSALSSPEVQLGHTKLTGRDLTGLKLEFFGGIALFLTSLQFLLSPS